MSHHNLRSTSAHRLGDHLRMMQESTSHSSVVSVFFYVFQFDLVPHCVLGLVVRFPLRRSCSWRCSCAWQWSRSQKCFVHLLYPHLVESCLISFRGSSHVPTLQNYDRYSLKRSYDSLLRARLPVLVSHVFRTNLVPRWTTKTLIDSFTMTGFVVSTHRLNLLHWCPGCDAVGRNQGPRKTNDEGLKRTTTNNDEQRHVTRDT